MAKQKLTQSEIDGVQYRRAKLWQIILYATNALCGMTVYTLMNSYASYIAGLGFAITAVTAGAIITGSRILDAVTDPLLALVYDKVETKFGKLRILLIGGFLLEAVALLLMYDGAGKAGLTGAAGLIVFCVLFVLYIIGYTAQNMTAQTLPAIMSNDPKQRPTIGVWVTAFNYLVPVVLSIVSNNIMLPRFGGQINLEFMSALAKLFMLLGFIGVILVSIGISEYDKPQYYKSAVKHEKLKIKDMLEVLAHNKPLQSYIAAQSSDKIAQITASQGVITTMLAGILIGNMGMATILTVVSMLPSIVFAVFGARYAGKHGSMKAIVTWTRNCIVISAAALLFFVVVNYSGIGTKSIAGFGPTMILYVVITLVLNGAKMCVTTASTSFMADVIDYELDRSGRYVPAVVTGTYSLIDKLISSVGALIAGIAIAIAGYHGTARPQPGDTATPAVFWVTMIVMYVVPIIGWVITLIAMKNCKLDKAAMVEVQKRIAEAKKAATADQA
ncbi:MAG: MFS transporter [Lachnospiraceae bacterium]|nr:MFS transporter [Lachnospiraceae bacterium]